MRQYQTAEQVWALRAEARESRNLARTMSDDQAILDLEAYASELEAEAETLPYASLPDRGDRYKFASSTY